MGADVTMYLEYQDSKDKKWKALGPFSADGRLLPIFDARAHNVEDMLENANKQYIENPSDVSATLSEKLKFHWVSKLKGEYSGVYSLYAVTVNEIQRVQLLAETWNEDDDFYDFSDCYDWDDFKSQIETLRHIVKTAVTLNDIYWMTESNMPLDDTSRLRCVCIYDN